MRYIYHLIRKYWYLLGFLFIIVLAAFLRFYNYENRWGLAYDQAHDAVVARYALTSHVLPFVGPFSSAGPFQTGGEWYWFIMAATAIYPGAVITPWVVLTFFYVIFVICITFVGKELLGKKFGLLVGLLAAVSTAQIAQGVNLTNQTPLSIIALCAIWSSIRYIKTKKLGYLFFLGLSVSAAATIHLQGASLLLLLLTTLIFAGHPTIKGVGALFVGIAIPLVPLLIFDIQNNFINSRSMLQYYLHDQYKISLDVLGRRWLTYAGIFWPKIWAHIIGGHIIIGYLLAIGLFFTVVYAFFKKLIGKEWYILLVSFFLMVILLRYIRTPLFDSYVVFLHPLIFLLTGWMIYIFYKRNSIFGAMLLVIVLAGSLQKDSNQIKGGENYTAFQARRWEETLLTKFPNKNFAIYDFKYKTVDKSLPLVLYLTTGKKISDKGMKIGITIATISGQFKYTVIMGDETGYQVLNLTSERNTELVKAGWVFINPSEIYRSTEEWYRKRK